MKKIYLLICLIFLVIPLVFALENPVDIIIDCPATPPGDFGCEVNIGSADPLDIGFRGASFNVVLSNPESFNLNDVVKTDYGTFLKFNATNNNLVGIFSFNGNEDLVSGSLAHLQLTATGDPGDTTQITLENFGFGKYSGEQLNIAGEIDSVKVTIYTETCGNGVVGADEQCDNGDDINTLNGCSASCTLTDEFVYGDINLDGDINVADLQCYILINTDLDAFEDTCGGRKISYLSADLNCDGSLNVMDQQIISQLVSSIVFGSGNSLGAMDSNDNGVADNHFCLEANNGIECLSDASCLPGQTCVGSVCVANDGVPGGPGVPIDGGPGVPIDGGPGVPIDGGPIGGGGGGDSGPQAAENCDDACPADQECIDNQCTGLLEEIRDILNEEGIYVGHDTYLEKISAIASVLKDYFNLQIN